MFFDGMSFDGVSFKQNYKYSLECSLINPAFKEILLLYAGIAFDGMSFDGVSFNRIINIRWNVI